MDLAPQLIGDGYLFAPFAGLLPRMNLVAALVAKDIRDLVHPQRALSREELLYLLPVLKLELLLQCINKILVRNLLVLARQALELAQNGIQGLCDILLILAELLLEVQLVIQILTELAHGGHTL